jgi:hypothetical protein
LSALRLMERFSCVLSGGELANAPVDISCISSSVKKIDRLNPEKLNAAEKETLAIALVKLRRSLVDI